MRVDASKAIKAFKKVERQLPKELTKGLRLLGREVLHAAQAKFAPISAATASKYRVRVSRIGLVTVDNPMRKTTGLRPDYGPLQMRKALVPALQEKELVVRQGLELMLEQAIEDNDLN